MVVYVVTDPELGWDCVVDVCTDEDFVKDQYASDVYIISEMMVNDETTEWAQGLPKNRVIPVFDEKTMSCFLDGYVGGDSDNKIPSQSDFEKFCDLVESFGDKNAFVVYCEEHKYHFIAYGGIAEDDFDWNDAELNRISEALNAHIERGGIIFG